MCIYPTSMGGNFLFNENFSALVARSFYLSSQRNLRQLKIAVEVLTRRMRPHVASVMTMVALISTNLWSCQHEVQI